MESKKPVTQIVQPTTRDNDEDYNFGVGEQDGKNMVKTLFSVRTILPVLVKNNKIKTRTNCNPPPPPPRKKN